MADEIPSCDHDLCNAPAIRLSPHEIEQVMACMLERGIVERVPGTDTYRLVEEYRRK